MNMSTQCVQKCTIGNLNGSRMITVFWSVTPCGLVRDRSNMLQLDAGWH
jgi:hypothetical protein